MLRVGIALLAPWAMTMAQQQPPAPVTGTVSPGATQSSSNTGASTSTNPSNPSPPQTQQQPAPRDSGSYLSGRVLLGDGTAPPVGILVRRICGSEITAETYADSRGYFFLRLTKNQNALGEPSSSGAFASPEAPPATSSLTRRAGNLVPNNQNDCEIRAVLAGYRSETLPLAGLRAAESEDLGTIFLYPQVANREFTISATTGFAPKDAHRFYEKGLDAVRLDGPDEAQKDFLRAVQIYPRFAEAWFELGLIYDRRLHPADARAAYSQAIAADPSYAKPYERLTMLNLKDRLWDQAAETSGKVMGLDPIDFPRAYYLNALANYEAHHLQAAEKSARQALEIQGDDPNPEVRYILGMILAEKGDLAGAAANLRAYLAEGTVSGAGVSAKKMLARIERNAQK